MLKCANVKYLGNTSDKWLYASVVKDSLVVLPSYTQHELLTVATQELKLGTVVGDEMAREPDCLGNALREKMLKKPKWLD